MKERKSNMKNSVVTQREPQVRRDDNVVERSYLSPEVNIFETKDSFILEAEMPGVNKDGLEVTLEGNSLTLVGRRDYALGNGQALYRESKRAHFRRVFELDPAIDTAKINAKIEQGI